MMAVFRCRMCGGKIEILSNETVVTCPYCNSQQSVPNLSEEKKTKLFRDATDAFLEHDFQKASIFYQIISSEYPNEAEAYWGMVLCKFGIEYVDDPDGKKVITCHQICYESIFNDPNYKKAISLTDVVAREFYQAEAKNIDAVQQEIISYSSKENYDVFICYKESDSAGNRTEDSVLSYRIYKALTDEGFNVFFARVSLEGKAGAKYEPIIFNALYSAKILIHVTTSIENTNSNWVKNEWERFLDKRSTDKKFIPCYKGLNPNELPQEMRYFQGVDLSKIGSIDDLVFGVEKLLKLQKSENVVDRAPELEEYDALEEEYKENVDSINQINDFPLTIEELDNLIFFFTNNINYKMSNKYLVLCKKEYIVCAKSFEECKQAEIYFGSISSEVPDSDKLFKKLEQKKKQAFIQEMTEKGLLVEAPSEKSIDSFQSTIASLELAEKQIKKEELTDEELSFIHESNYKVISYLNEEVKEAKGNSIYDIEKLKEKALEFNKAILSEAFGGTFINCLDSKIKLIEENERKEKKKKTLTITGITIGVAAILATIISTITITVQKSNYNHSPDSITIKFVSKQQEYKPYVSKYTNGCYYIYFGIEVISDSDIKISSMKFDTDVTSNNKGFHNANLTSNLDGNIKAKGTSNFELTYEDNQPVENGNNGFISIYNTDIKDMTFTSKITYISFSDGTYYRT